MGLLDIIKSRKEKKLPLVERVDLTKVKEERENNKEIKDVSVLARRDYTNRVKNKIRLCYVSLSDVYNSGTKSHDLESTFGSTCVFNMPNGMNLEQAGKIISYLMERAEARNNKSQFDPEISVEWAGVDLLNFGFSKQEYGDPDYSHSHRVTPFNPNIPNVFVETENVVKKDIEGVYDFVTVGGDPYLFIRSDLELKDCTWYKEGVKFEEIKKIYEKLGLQVNKHGVMNAKAKD